MNEFSLSHDNIFHDLKKLSSIRYTEHSAAH